MSVDISVSITEDIVDIIATPTVNIVNVTNSASIDPSLYDLSEFTNTSPNPFVRTSGLSSYVPTSRTLTINGLAQDLSTDRSWTISTGLTVGTTPIASGTIGRVLFQGTGNVLQQSSSLFWDNTNGRLGIGTSSPSQTLDVNGNIAVNNSVYVFSAAYSSYTRALYDDGSLSTVVRGNTHLDFWTANNFRMRVNNSGNVLINTTTDAGFRLDVNGTARVQGQLTTTTANAQFGAIGASTGEFRIDGVNGAAYAFSVYSSSTLRFGVTGFGGITAPGGLIISSTSDLNTTRLRLGTSSSTAPINIQAQSGNADTIVLKASNGVDQFIIKNATGNVLINTTTDAGFKLDVNGTARVSGAVTGTSFTATSNGTSYNIGATNVLDKGDGVRINYASGAGKVTIFSNVSGGGMSLHNSGNVSIGSTATEETSAVLNVPSTTKGFLPPRMTTTQRNAIASPAAGLIVYDTTLNLPHFFNGTIWVSL